MTVKEHYATHLGNFYSWMIGEFKEKQEEQESFFKANQITAVNYARAFDLGCGNGLQAISLARLGYTVDAVDFNEQLLRELEERKKQLSIHIHHEDCLEFLEFNSDSVELIVCMGDTLTHLNSKEQVQALISKSYECLIEGGHFIVSFRDLMIELIEENRFILVKSDSKRIHTCFLEYFPGMVKVHDILHEFDGVKWKKQVSWYPKLRLDSNQIKALYEKAGFILEKVEVIKGMIHMIARKQVLRNQST